MALVHFWKDGKVISLAPNFGNVYTTRSAVQDQMTDYFCYDANGEDDFLRYGMYESKRSGNWRSHDINTFPAEFRLWLLVLT